VSITPVAGTGYRERRLERRAIEVLQRFSLPPRTVPVSSSSISRTARRDHSGHTTWSLDESALRG